MSEPFDAVVVGSGPNGLTAAAVLTRAGRRVLVVEGSDRIGGGTRTEELTLPGFRHDICSAIHPLGAGSPIFRELGVGSWLHPGLPVTHPLDHGRVGVIHRDIDITAQGLGADGSRYLGFIGPLVRHADELVASVLGPLDPTRHPVTSARFGAIGLPSASAASRTLTTPEARALLAGMAAHAIAPLTAPLTSGVSALFFTSAHAYGWPMAVGGSVTIADELAQIVLDGGGEIETGRWVTSLDTLPSARTVMLDVMPPAALMIAGSRLSAATIRKLASWEGGSGVFKVDWALDGPVPWADPSSRSAGTVHVGGTFEEIAEAEAIVASGGHPDRPFVIVTQQSLFDTSRAPDGMQTLWGYCHVPAGSEVDMTDAIERQIERFAPGFRDRIVVRRTMTTVDYENHNPNYLRGDIAGGSFGMRRALRMGSKRHYQLSDGLYLCGSSTPPGAGVHGMNGYHAARAAIADGGR